MSKARSNVFNLHSLTIVTDPVYGAKGNGVADDQPGFQAAVNSVASGSPVHIIVPGRAWVLNSSVVANGRIVSWEIDPAATFSGVGTLPSLDSANYGDKGIKNSILAVQRGTAAVTNTDPSAVMFLKKVTAISVTSGRNSTGVFSIEKRGATTAANSRAEAVFGEALDYSGGAGSFVEGGRFHGIVMTGGTHGSGYGCIGFAGAEAAVTWDYLVAFEGDVSNQTTDAPVSGSFSSANFCTAFLATSGLSGTKHADAGFMTNPFAAAGGKFRTGLLIPDGSVTTDGVAIRASIINGLNLAAGIYSNAVLLLPNNSVVRAKNALNTLDHNILYYNTSNEVVIGTDAVSVKLQVVDNAVANPLLRDIVYGAADSGSRGAGFRALQVPN